jgi:hypothetical protein
MTYLWGFKEKHLKQVSNYGAAPRLFRPMYAGANMGHPSREMGRVGCSNVVTQPRFGIQDLFIWTALKCLPSLRDLNEAALQRSVEFDAVGISRGCRFKFR